MLNWRDRTHPEGGGSEQYLEEVAAHLARAGRRVTLVCADHGGAPREEVTADGVHIVRRGGRLSVYAQAARYLRRHRHAYDVVVDVQNGLPFWSPLVGGPPTVALVHHVHREQWPVVFPRRQAAVGWYLESRLAPRVYRHSAYVAVSQVTADELAGLGVSASRISVVHNGVEKPPVVDVPRSPTPRVCVVNRLVPHKRVEIAMDAVVQLAEELPDLHLDVVGDGYWYEPLRSAAAERGIAHRTEFHGHVDDRTKHELMAQAWVHLVPSLKEGWGLTVVESALHATPTVAFHGAGGLEESVLDGVTGLLADGPEQFVGAVRRLLTDRALRERLGAAAQARAATFDWAQTAERFGKVLDAAVRDA